MSRETIIGVLHVILTLKRHNEGLLDTLMRRVLEDAGQLEPDYYPPTYFILSDQTIGDRRTDKAKWRNNEPFQFRFRGRPKALSPELRGHEIIVKASVESSHNGFGGYLDRPQVIDVGAYVECPHHDDPYDEPERGSARVFCKKRLDAFTGDTE